MQSELKIGTLNIFVEVVRKICLILQELKEQNELLYETKLVLEEQLTGLNSKEERIGEQLCHNKLLIVTWH